MCVVKFFFPLSENPGNCPCLVSVLLIIRNPRSSPLSPLQKNSELICHASSFESHAAPCPCAVVCSDLCGSLEWRFHSIFWSCWSPHCPVTPVAISSNYSPSPDLLCAVLRSSVTWCPLGTESGTTLMCLFIRITSVYHLWWPARGAWSQSQVFGNMGTVMLPPLAGWKSVDFPE